jgi:hypothetical protein
MKQISTIAKLYQQETFPTKEGDTMNRYNVTTTNGVTGNFYWVGQLKFKEGDEVEYDYDANKKKFVKINPTKTQAFTQPKGNYSNPKDDVQKYIIRQSSLNRATDLFAGKPINVDEIINLARTFENYVHNG